jgi:hypothetical protein
MMKKTTIFIVVLFLIILLSQSSIAIKIFPGTMTIRMPDGYPEEPINYKIQVNNENKKGVNVSAQASNPINLTSGFSNIPDLSWIRIEPETLYVPGKSHEFFNVFIDIPEDKRSLHYDESWKSKITVSTDPPKAEEGGVSFKIVLAVDLFIHTPPGEKLVQEPPTLYYILVLVAIVISIIVVVILLKKR